MKYLVWAFVLILLASENLVAADAVRSSVVRLHVTRRAPNLFHPWTKASPKKLSGSGAVISEGRILTNAHVVQFGKQVFVQLHQGGDRLPAKIVAIAPRIDLAIVELEDSTLLEEIVPLELTKELPTIKSTVNVYGYPLGGDNLSVTEGIVSRIEFTDYRYDGAGVRIQVDAALNSGNSGGPAMQEGKITGLVFSGIKEADNIGYLIPAEEIQTFLDDVADGTYDGKPRLFDSFNTAENKALRDYLRLPDEATGVVVGKPYHKKDYPLQTWDVVTHIGPHAIDNQGYVFFNDELRIKFSYYVSKLAEDGHIGLTIYREGKPQQIAVPVAPDRSLLMPSLRNTYPKYFIHGPLVFTIATQELLRGLGTKGTTWLSLLESPLVERRYDQPAFPGEELVIIATRAFPHRTTKGYGMVALGVVTHFNDQAVKNLRHFAEQIRGCEDEFIKLTLAGKNESLVFRRSEMEDSSEEILADEGIRFSSSPELRDLWQ